jgi:hypothetical protein
VSVRGARLRRRGLYHCATQGKAIQFSDCPSASLRDDDAAHWWRVPVFFARMLVLHERGRAVRPANEAIQ